MKPVEPEKITGNLTKDVKESSPEVVVRPPIQPAMVRPSKDVPLVRLKPTVAASLVKAVAALPAPTKEENSSAIKEGESCKNNGCKKTYPGDDQDCLFHPGFPVFHEVTFTQPSDTTTELALSGYEILVLLSEKDH